MESWSSTRASSVGIAIGVTWSHSMEPAVIAAPLSVVRHNVSPKDTRAPHARRSRLEGRSPVMRIMRLSAIARKAVVWGNPERELEGGIPDGFVYVGRSRRLTPAGCVVWSD